MKTTLLISLLVLAIHAAPGGQLTLASATVDGGGTSTAAGGRFRLEATAGQADTGTLASHDATGPDGRFTLRGGFYWPGYQLRIAQTPAEIIVHWETGLGYEAGPAAAVLEYTQRLEADPRRTVWTRVPLPPESRAASFPRANAPRFIRIREK